jgi:photosystem II stability/assembly factor-like uncharacterized protein
MIWLLVALVVAVLLLTVTMCRTRSEQSPSVHPAEAAQAAVELHRIARQLDSSFIKSEQRRDAAELRREIGNALDDTDGP